MAKPIAVFFADTHIDVNAWASHPGLSGDSMFAFRYVCDKAIELKVKDVFCAGDVFDARKPPTECIEFMRLRMDSLQQAGISFYYIQGQHDMAEPPWLKAIHDWPTHLHKDVAVLANRETVYGLDWLPATRLEGALQEIPPTTDIYMGHQVWSDFMGDVALCEGNFGMVRYATRVFTGDYHRKMHWPPGDSGLRGKDGQQLEIISPGSTNLRSITETRVKYYCVYLDDGSWKFHSIPQRPAIDFDVEDTSDIDQILATWDQRLSAAMAAQTKKISLPKQLCTPIAYVRYRETVADTPARLERALGDRAFWFFKCLESSNKETDARRASVREVLTRGLAGCLELVVPPTDPRHQPLSAMISSVDPVAVLAELRSGFITNEEFTDGPETG